MAPKRKSPGSGGKGTAPNKKQRRESDSSTVTADSKDSSTHCRAVADRHQKESAPDTDPHYPMDLIDRHKQVKPRSTNKYKLRLKANAGFIARTAHYLEHEMLLPDKTKEPEKRNFILQKRNKELSLLLGDLDLDYKNICAGTFVEWGLEKRWEEEWHEMQMKKARGHGQTELQGYLDEINKKWPLNGKTWYDPIGNVSEKAIKGLFQSKELS